MLFRVLGGIVVASMFVAAHGSPMARAAEPPPELAAHIAALRAPDVTARIRAADALAQLGQAAAGAVDPLVAALQDDNPLVRSHAAFALGQIGVPAPAAVDALARLIADPDRDVRRAAIAALRQLRAGPQVTIPLLVKVLESAEPSERMLAIRSLAEQGEEAVPTLIEALRNEKSRYWALLVAHEMGPAARDAVPALLTCLSDPLQECRLEALMALGAVAPQSEEAIRAIRRALSDKETGVRYAAVYALGSIGPPAASASADLERLVRGSDDFLRVVSAWALVKIHPDNARHRQVAIPLLLEACSHKDESTRLAAIKALADLHPPATTVIPALERALHDERPQVVLAAVDALAGYGADGAAPLVKALNDERLRLPAVLGLRRLGPDARAAVEPLLQLLQSESHPEMRQEIYFALGAIGPGAQSAVDTLVAHLQSDDLRVRYGATYVLGKIGPDAQRAVPALTANFENSDDARLKLASLWALLQIQPENRRLRLRALPLLVEALGDEAPLVRREAALALGRLGPAGRAAVQALQRALHDRDASVRDAVQEALQQIESR